MNKIISKLQKVDKKFDESTEDLMDLEDNWDMMGARSYKEETVEKAKEITKQIIKTLHSKGCSISIPKLLPLENGSFDINWKEDNISLIINIPRQKSQRIQTYGESPIFSELDYIGNNIDFIINWLIEIKNRIKDE
jgi:hypothetical protein